MRTIFEADLIPVSSFSNLPKQTDVTTTTNISSDYSRSNSNESEDETNFSDFIFVHSTTTLKMSNSEENFYQTNSEDDDQTDYLNKFLCPEESDDELFYLNDENNNEIFLKKHLNKKQENFVDYLQDNKYHRSKRSNKKINAQRQIKTKHAKSIRIKSHNKHLFIHHRLAKKVLLDGPSYHCIPSSEPVPLYTSEALRTIVYYKRHPYSSPYVFQTNSSKKIRHSKLNYQIYIDEPQINFLPNQFRDYTLNEYNIPDELSYDDTMINFLLDMQNRDLSPEDYEMLLRLDERVQRKTINTNLFDTLPTIDVNQTHIDDQCTICMEKYQFGQKIKLLPCQHIFHSNCIEIYLKDFSNQCPLDNLPLI